MPRHTRNRAFKLILFLLSALIVVHPTVSCTMREPVSALAYTCEPLATPAQDDPVANISEQDFETATSRVKCDVWIEPPPRAINYDLIPLSKSLQEYIYVLCDAYLVPVELALAVIEAESNFIDGLISETGDYGLMQINVCCHGYLAESLGVSDVLDSYQNVHCGIWLLSKKLEVAGWDVQLALICYNLGDFGGLNEWENGTKSTFYSEKVISLYYKYVELLNGIE